MIYALMAIEDAGLDLDEVAHGYRYLAGVNGMSPDDPGLEVFDRGFYSGMQVALRLVDPKRKV